VPVPDGFEPLNRQIAQELDLDEDDVQAMTVQLRQGIVDSKSSYQEMLNVMKFMSAQDTRAINGCQKKGDKGGVTVSKGSGSGTLEKKSRQYLGFSRRRGRDSDACQCKAGDHQTINQSSHCSRDSSTPMSTLFTLLSPTGAISTKRCVMVAASMLALEDGDGFCEVHVNTREGFWSLLRSWLRPHRSLPEKLPLLGLLRVCSQC